MKRFSFCLLLFVSLIFLFPISVKASWCFKDSEVEPYLKPLFLGGQDLYHHTSQGMCVAGDYVVYTRFNTDSDATTYVIIDIKTKKEVAHYDFHTLHSNSLAYNPDTHQVVVASRQHAFVFDFNTDTGEMTPVDDIVLSHNCPKIAYVSSKKAFYLGTSTGIYKAKDLHHLEKAFSVSQDAVNQGMGSDGKYLYICWYRDANNHMNVYDTDGHFIRKITLKSTTYREIEDVDFKGDVMYLNIANSESQNGVHTVSSVHAFSKWQVDKKPTCAKEGARHRVCTSCGRKEEEVIPATNKHQAGDWIVTKKPTCTAKGEHKKECKVCKKLMKKEPIPELGHAFSSYVVVQEPDVLHEGKKERYCERCKKTENLPIAKLPAIIRCNVSYLPMRKYTSTDCISISLGKGDFIKRWASDNPDVASVDQGGTVCARAEGTATITVRSEGGAVATITIKVQWLPILTEHIHCRTETIHLKKGDSRSFSATPEPLTSDMALHYESSDSSIFSISKKGVLHAHRKGKATLTISSWFANEVSIPVVVSNP